MPRSRDAVSWLPGAARVRVEVPLPLAGGATEVGAKVAVAPAGTPDAFASKLQAAVVDALNDEEVKKRFSDLGAEPVGSTPAQFADYLKKEDAKWSEVVRKGNIKAD